MNSKGNLKIYSLLKYLAFTFCDIDITTCFKNVSNVLVLEERGLRGLKYILL
jgi:hypothetical protein